MNNKLITNTPLEPKKLWIGLGTYVEYVTHKNIAYILADSLMKTIPKSHAAITTEVRGVTRNLVNTKYTSSDTIEERTILAEQATRGVIRQMKISTWFGSELMRVFDTDKRDLNTSNNFIKIYDPETTEIYQGGSDTRKFSHLEHEVLSHVISTRDGDITLEYIQPEEDVYIEASSLAIAMGFQNYTPLVIHCEGFIKTYLSTGKQGRGTRYISSKEWEAFNLRRTRASRDMYTLSTIRELYAKKHDAVEVDDSFEQEDYETVAVTAEDDDLFNEFKKTCKGGFYDASLSEDSTSPEFVETFDKVKDTYVTRVRKRFKSKTVELDTLMRLGTAAEFVKNITEYAITGPEFQPSTSHGSLDFRNYLRETPEAKLCYCTSGMYGEATRIEYADAKTFSIILENYRHVALCIALVNNNGICVRKEDMPDAYEIFKDETEEEGSMCGWSHMHDDLIMLFVEVTDKKVESEDNDWDR